MQQSQPQQQIIIQRSPQTCNQVQIVQQAPQQTAPQTQQIIVNNTNLAQQLAQGKLQVASVNGQQVIIKPMGNNQVQIVAHIKTQVDGQSHIVANQTIANTSEQTETIQTQLIHQQQQPVVQQQKILIQQKPIIQQRIITSPTQSTNNYQQQQQQQIPSSPSLEQSMLQGQPPGTVIKSVTAQVIQTQNGRRIVLQGLQGNDFTPQQLELVQQQVKQQLLKGKRR